MIEYILFKKRFFLSGFLFYARIIATTCLTLTCGNRKGFFSSCTQLFLLGQFKHIKQKGNVINIIFAFKLELELEELDELLLLDDEEDDDEDALFVLLDGDSKSCFSCFN